MNRRNLIKKMGVVALYGSFPSVLSEFLVSCKAKDKMLRAGFFSNEEFELLKQSHRCNIAPNFNSWWTGREYSLFY